MQQGQERQLSANSAIVTIDHEGIIQSVDKGACQMFGYELEELMGQKVNVLLPTPYREQHDTYLAEYHRTGTKKVIGKSRLVEAQHKDGAIFPIRLSVSEVNVGEGTMYIGMLDRVEDSAGTITANHEGIIIFCNKNCEAIFGYTVGEMVGKNLNMLMPSPHAERHDSYLAEYHRTGKMKVIGHTRNVPAKHKNGTVFPICLQVTKLKVGVVDLFKGRVERVCNDCEAVFTLSKQGTIVSCNRNFVTPLFGYSDTELIGKHISILVPSLCSPAEKVLGGKGVKRKREASDESLVAEVLRDRGNNNNNNEGGGEEEEEEEEKEGAGEDERDGEVPSAEEDAGSGGGCPVMSAEEGDNTELESKQSDFSISGRRRLEVRHKDGSTFPVDFSISKFQQDNIVFYSGRIRRVSEPPKDTPPSTTMSGEDGASSELHEKSESLTFVGDYIVEGNVGQGSYGKVKLATHKLTGQKVAIKILQKDLMDKPEVVRSKREVEIQMKLSHPNIVKLFDVVETEDRMYIIMEYSEGGELLSYINQKGKLSDVEARRLFLQLLSAVQYCHRHNIIHRDIKHKNILLDGDLNLKLIDFGLSNYIQFDHLRSTFCGTPAYAAPEMILAKKYIGPEVDIWSMGVVLYSMVCGRFPFGNVSNIIDGQFTIPSHLNPVLADLIKRMLVVDTSKRATISDVARHPWVQIGATTTTATINPNITDQISSFMASKQPSPSSSSTGGCPVFHGGTTSTMNRTLPPQHPQHPPITPRQPPSLQPYPSSPSPTAIYPQNVHMTGQYPTQHPQQPQPQQRKYPALSPKFNGNQPTANTMGYKYNPIAPAQPFYPLGVGQNTHATNNSHNTTSPSTTTQHSPSSSSSSNHEPSDLQDLLNRMRNPMFPTQPATGAGPPKSEVEALIESYGYTGVNFGRNLPPPTKKRRENPPQQQQQPAPQQQPLQQDEVGGSEGVKDVSCSVVSTEKQG